jgi:hypothetical protein
MDNEDDVGTVVLSQRRVPIEVWRPIEAPDAGVLGDAYNFP